MINMHKFPFIALVIIILPSYPSFSMADEVSIKTSNEESVQLHSNSLIDSEHILHKQKGKNTKYPSIQSGNWKKTQYY